MEATSRTRPTILALSGSLRKGAYSTLILGVISDYLAEHAEVVPFSVGTLPLYDSDQEEAAQSGPVGELRRALAAADAVVVVTPEYNYSIPGPLKNALDWASRPAFKSGFVGKPVLPIANSMAFTGGARVHAHLRDVFGSVLARTVPFAEVCIGQVHTKCKDGKLTDEGTQQVLQQAAKALLEDIERFTPGRA